MIPFHYHKNENDFCIAFIIFDAKPKQRCLLGFRLYCSELRIGFLFFNLKINVYRKFP